MKCISKFKKLLCLTSIAAIFMTGCGQEAAFESPYNVYASSLAVQTNEKDAATGYFSDKYAVTEDINYGTEQTDAWVAEGAGAFNVDRNQVLYSQNMFEKLYPASTTKVMTAYLILKYGKLDDMVTVNAEAADQASDSSIANLKEGDVLTVRDLLYGLMLPSGNDAAIMLAYYLSGSVESFAQRMTEEAHALGATKTNFVNANGLPDDNHYTTIYDMYLIFSAAIENEEFIKIISAETYDATYHDKDGNEVLMTWRNTNRYINGKYKAPEGFEIIGGKTGTTNEAGYCLVLLSKNSKGEKIISIVYKADCVGNLYLLMNEILSEFAN